LLEQVGLGSAADRIHQIAWHREGSRNARGDGS
jgi:hypothetical protein